MIDYMLQKDSLKNDFEKFGLGSEKDIAFIKNLILGNKDLEVRQLQIYECLTSIACIYEFYEFSTFKCQ